MLPTTARDRRHTDGAARTTLAAKDLINNDTPLLIANSDQVITWDPFVFSSLLRSVDALALFSANETKWSYAVIDGGRVTRVAEKEVISNNGKRRRF